MNERIRELAKESRLLTGWTVGEVEYQKFAELIVKETIDEMIHQMWNYGIDQSNNPSFYKAIEKTKEHFGLKE